MITSTRHNVSPLILLLLSSAAMLVVLPVQSLSPCSSSQSSAWQICGPVISNSGINVQPSVIQASDGTLRMAWTSIPTTDLNIFLATGTWNGTGWNWNAGTSITNQAGTNENPSLVQLQNGTFILFFVYASSTSKHLQLYYITSNGAGWSKQYTPVRMSSPSTLNDTLPATTVGRDGTVWIVWTRTNSTTGSVTRQLWYKTLKGNVWSIEQPLTRASSVYGSLEPTVVAGKDSTIRVAYANSTLSTGNSQIYYMSYNGVSWSTPVPLTTQTTTGDTSPSMMQDRNGTLWVFWARNVPSGTSSAYVIYDRSSANNGASWTSETALTGITCGIVCVDSENPSAVQSTADKNIWVFYATNPGSNFNIYALKTTLPIFPVHDVRLTFFSPNASRLFAGGFYNPYTPYGVPINQSPVVQILVSLQNIGDFNETVTLSITATNTTRYSIGVQVLQVLAGAQSLPYFYFNTTGVRPARYGIYGNASIPVASLGNKLDGILSTKNMIHLDPWGDVDQDGADTISDVSQVLYNYGFTCYTVSTCSPRYVAVMYGDVDGHGIIDIIDVGIVLKNFGIIT